MPPAGPLAGVPRAASVARSSPRAPCSQAADFAPLETCGRQAAALITDSRLVVYEDAAHMPQLSHSDRLSADLLAFAHAT